METLYKQSTPVSDSRAETNGHHGDPGQPSLIEQRKRQRGPNRLIRLLLALLDVLTVYGSFLVAHAIGTQLTLFPDAELPPLPLVDVLIFGGISAVLAAGFMTWQGTYTPSINHMKLDGDRRFIRALIMTTFVIFVPFFYTTHADTRELLTITVVVLPTLMILQKTLVVAILSKHYDRPERTRKLLIIGCAQDAPYVLRQALSCWDPGYLPVGFVSREAEGTAGRRIETESKGLVGSAPVIGTYDQIEKLVKRHTIEEIWINDPEMGQDELVTLLAMCDERGVVASMLPRIGRIPAMAVAATYAGGQVLLRQRHAPERLYYDRMKRVVDLVASVVGLIFLFPVLFVLGMWVRLDSKGPMFFRQDRVGKDGKLFKMYKFRSMHIDAPKYSVSPTDRFDPRITRAGRFLRRTSLDELPQLINVLRGEMSLVGPRPEQPFLTEGYDRFQRARLQVKPGITGLWQISADRSIPIHDNLDYDLYYIQNRSLTTDMVILWRTIYFAMTGI